MMWSRLEAKNLKPADAIDQDAVFLPPFFIFRDEDLKPFEKDYSLRAADTPDRKEGKLLVKPVQL